MRSDRYLFTKGCNLYVLLFVFFVNHSFAQEIKEQEITITGRVAGFEKSGKQKTIRLAIRSLINDDVPIVSAIDSSGKFSFSARVAYAQNMIIHYGNAITFLCKPGDKMNLLIVQNKNGKFTAEVLGGSHAKENKLVQAFLQLRDSCFPQDIEQHIIKSAGADEFKRYVYRQRAADDSLLKQFSRSGSMSTFFIQWAEDYIRYSAWNKLLRYCWEHPMLNGQSRKKFMLPETYFDFLDNYNMNDVKVISTPHADFLHEMYMRLANNMPPFAETGNQDQTQQQNIIHAISSIIHSIQKHTSGFTRDVFLTRLYIDILNGNDLKAFEACWQDTLILASHFKRIISEKKMQVVRFVNNQDTNTADLITLHNRQATGILDSILKRYTGEVIYMDFWAPWCAPCLEEMPASKLLQQEYRDKEIVFLFLSNRSSEASWKSTIANYGLTGQHLNLTDDEFNLLSQTFKINGIPHYVIIDKRGRIVNHNAPSPGKKQELKAELDRLLK